jgi:hypothetical protein
LAVHVEVLESSAGARASESCGTLATSLEPPVANDDPIAADGEQRAGDVVEPDPNIEPVQIERDVIRRNANHVASKLITRQYPIALQRIEAGLVDDDRRLG